MNRQPTAEDELATLQRVLDRRRHHVDPETGQCAVCNRMTERRSKASGCAPVEVVMPADICRLEEMLKDAEQMLHDMTGVTDAMLGEASGPATRGSGEAETRDRGGDKVPKRVKNPVSFEDPERGEDHVVPRF